MKKILFLLSFLCFSTSFLYSFDTSFKKDDVFRTEITDNSFHMTFDLGLNANLLQDLQDLLGSSLDSLFDPIVLELQDLKRENIKRLNFDNSPSSGASDWLMDSIGLKDGVFLKAGKVCDSTSTSTYCNYAGKEQYFAMSDYNPFNDIREDIKTQFNQYIDDIKKMDSDFRNRVNTAWENSIGKVEIDGFINENLKFIFSDPITNAVIDKLEDSEILNENKKESAALKALLTDPSKTPSMVAYDYIKSSSDLLDTNHVGLEYGSNIESPGDDVSNNLCDLALKMFDVNSPFQEKINERLSKLRQELYKYAVTSIIKEIQDQLGFITAKQYLSKVTQCSIEASIAVASTSFDGLSSVVSVVDTTSVANSVTQKASNPTASNQGNSSNASKDNSTLTSAQKCASELNDKNTKNTEIELKGGVSNKSTINVYWPSPLFDFKYAPWSNLSLGFKAAGNWVSNLIKVKSDFLNCNVKGKTQGWKTAFQKCINGNSALEFKIHDKIDSEIAKLFKNVRKMKKKNCEMFSDSTKTELLHMNTLKFIMEPTPPTPTYSSDGTFSFFGNIALKLVQNKVNIPKDKTPQTTLYYNEIEKIKSGEQFEKKDNQGNFYTTRKFKTMGDLINCADLDENLTPHSCSWQTLTQEDTNKGLLKVGLKNFCSHVAEDIIKPANWQYILTKITSKTGEDTVEYSSDIQELLSNMYHCSNIITNIIKEPIIKKSTDIITDITETESVAAVDYLIDQKFLLKNGDISNADYLRAKVSVNTQVQNFQKIDEFDKFNLCINSKKQEDLLRPSMVYKFCKQYKIEQFNKIFIEAKKGFKQDTDGRQETLNALNRDIQNKFLELQKKFKIQ